MSTPDERPSTLELLQQIQAGQLSPKSLSVEERQDIAQLLMGKGYQREEIARILQRSDRTIRRDLQRIRERNALSRNEDLGPMLAGELIAESEQVTAQLKRIAYSQDATSSERRQALLGVWKVIKELAERLGVMGFTGSGNAAAKTSNRHSRSLGGMSPERMLEFFQKWDVYYTKEEDRIAAGLEPSNCQSSNMSHSREAMHPEWARGLRRLNLARISFLILMRKLMELGYKLKRAQALRDGMSLQEFEACIKRVPVSIFDPDYDKKLKEEKEAEEESRRITESRRLNHGEDSNT